MCIDRVSSTVGLTPVCASEQRCCSVPEALELTSTAKAHAQKESLSRGDNRRARETGPAKALSVAEVVPETPVVEISRTLSEAWSSAGILV